MMKCSRDLNEGTNRSGQGGRRARDVTPDLSYCWEGAREYHSARKINGMKGEKKKKKKSSAAVGCCV